MSRSVMTNPSIPGKAHFANPVSGGPGYRDQRTTPASVVPGWFCLFIVVYSAA